MAKDPINLLDEIRDRLSTAGYAASITLSLCKLPASLWKENKFKPSPEMLLLVKEAKATRRSLNHVVVPCWNLMVVVQSVALVHGGLYALTAQEACARMLLLVKRLCRQGTAEYLRRQAATLPADW
jgi:hypothetical protein